jgi:uncharacterized repeat protein (TIGR03803 family)
VDGESRLDNSMILYGCGNGDGNRRTHADLPILLAGGGGGSLNGGRYVKHPSVPLTNLCSPRNQPVNAAVAHQSSTIGNLYGTTEGGGASRCGTIFKIIMPIGTFTNLASFNSTDGNPPSHA